MLLQVSLLFLLAFDATLSEKVSKEEVKTLSDDYFDFRLRENPSYAAAHGIGKYMDKVEEWNYSAFNRREAKSREFLTRVDALLTGDINDRRDVVSLKIIKFTIEKFLEGSAYLNYTVTLNGDLSDIANSLTLRPITTMVQLRNWYKKVVAYQTVFTDQTNLLDFGLQLGLFQTQLAANEYLSSYKKALGDSSAEFFAFKPWKDLDVMTSNRTFYDEGKLECDKLRDKMSAFATKLESEYIPMCRDMNHTGVSYLPGGDKFYEATLKYYTSDDITPEKAHQLGLDEVDRISKSMNKIVEDEGFNGTVREFVNTLYADPNEYFPTQETLKQGYEDMLNNQVRPKMSKEFNPEPPIDLVIIDDPYGSLGRYVSPTRVDNSWTAGSFVYDGSKPTELLKISMLPILVHETLPGHHYQLASVLLTTLPDFRKYTAYGHYAQGAYNFPYHGVYIEGWGLYSEYVSEVMGIISTDRQKLGRFSMESLRAARLVVDTGMHYYNWTYDRAVDYLIEYTILSPDTCRGQIERYIRWPGQACSYKIGELKLKEIRNNAMTTLGEAFNPKAFHQAIIDLGAVPLEILEDEMNNWISQQPITSSATIGRPWPAVVAGLILIVLYM